MIQSQLTPFIPVTILSQIFFGTLHLILGRGLYTYKKQKDKWFDSTSKQIILNQN